MKHYSFALVGFGNVGQAFARLLLRKRSFLNSNHGIDFAITGIMTRRHGAAINPSGIAVGEALELVGNDQRIDRLSVLPQPRDPFDFIRTCPADVLFENTPVNHQDGQPASAYLQAALERGLHAITANKGPVVHAYAQLTDLARKKQRRFLFESAVMDGAPIFSLFRGALPAAELVGFHGILNSCTNLILQQMEQGLSFNAAVTYAQSIGIAETDPAADIDGWDAAIKIAALSTVLMGAPLKPDRVAREGIRGITPSMIEDARQAGERWKLVCRAFREGERIVARVAPERVGPSSPLYNIEGTSSYVQFELDVLPGLGIVETNPGPETTAYGLLADLINADREL